MHALNRDGTFGLNVFRQGTLNGPGYHRLLQYSVLPELRRWNGGNLDRLWWQQDGATVHVTDVNMRYLDTQFGPRVISRRPIRGIDWPARSPDLNPLDFCLWGYLKSKVTFKNTFQIQSFKLSLLRCDDYLLSTPGLHTMAGQP